MTATQYSVLRSRLVDTADKTALYGYAGGTVQARRLAEYTGVQEAKIRYSEYIIIIFVQTNTTMLPFCDVAGRSGSRLRRILRVRKSDFGPCASLPG
jgi:hypothetical protein